MVISTFPLVSTDFAIPDDNWDLESNSSGLSSYSEEEEGQELVDKEMDKYMQKMDHELLNTDVPRTSVDNPNRKVRLLLWSDHVTCVLRCH